MCTCALNTCVVYISVETLLQKHRTEDRIVTELLNQWAWIRIIQDHV